MTASARRSRQGRFGTSAAKGDAGIEPLLAANRRWGDCVGRFASGYFVSCRAR